MVVALPEEFLPPPAPSSIYSEKKEMTNKWQPHFQLENISKIPVLASSMSKRLGVFKKTRDFIPNILLDLKTLDK